MTDKEIRKTAMRRITHSSDIITLSSVYFFFTFTTVMLFEDFIMSSFALFGNDDFTFKNVLRGRNMPLSGMFFALRLLVYFIAISSVSKILLRYFINMNAEGDADRFTRMHWGRLLPPSIKGSVLMLLYKLMVSSPLIVGIGGILHFRDKGMSEQLSFGDLVLFMLSIGFTIVWAGELVHYFISLSLVKYIIAINPRANFFDACDLSVKLMDGKHQRYFEHLISLLPCLLPAVFIYPLLIIYPFMIEANLLFAKEIMGDYWQDKIPTMARRWERQQERLRRP